MEWVVKKDGVKKGGIMWIEKLEEQYKKHENIVKAIAGVSLGTVLGMWAYGKYKQSKTSKVIDKGLEIEKKN